MRRCRSLIPLLALVALFSLTPASAGADAISRVKAAFAKQGTIRACQFSIKTLVAASHEVDSYDAQYNNELPIAIQDAEKASSQCGKRQTSGTVHVTQLAPLPKHALPASVTGRSDTALPAPVLIGAALAFLLVLLGAALAAFRLGGFEPAWVLDWRQAWAEAGDRVDLWWASVRDRRAPR